jgi:hypothetical protein
VLSTSYIQGSGAEIQIQHTGTWSFAPPSRQCYRPTVFFSHLPLVSLSFPATKKFGHTFKKISVLPLSLKLRNLKLRKSGSAYTPNKSYALLVCNNYVLRLRYFKDLGFVTSPWLTFHVEAAPLVCNPYSRGRGSGGFVQIKW